MLYIVATPIGNLEDITLRALKVLREVDLILAEDTRRTRLLLARYQIEKPLLSYHQHSRLQKINYILSQLQQGRKLALVCDAGTPGISDPAGKLVASVLAKLPEVKIVPVPGPSAITTLASVAGVPMERFFFLGFLPKKKGRNRLVKLAVEIISRYRIPVMLFESPERTGKTLADFQKQNPSLLVVVGRELTKKFEEIWRGKIASAINHFENRPPKGELVLIFHLAE